MTDKISEVFNEWNNLKINIHKSDKFAYPQVRDIWWVSLGQNIGVEINGKNHKFERPVVVIKVFNTYGILVAPTTSKIKQGKYFVNFVNNENTLKMINMSQIRSISSKRFIRKIEEITPQDFKKIKKVLLSFAR